MEEKDEKAHPIEEATNTFLHSVRDIEAAVKVFMPIGHEILRERWKETVNSLKESVDKIKSDDDEVRTLAQIAFDQQYTRMERLENTKLPYHLEKSLFIGLFSAYDAFIGDLLKAIFGKRPELLKKITKTIDLSSIVAASDLEQLKNEALEEYIEDFRRDGYAKQFECLEKFFELQLTKFSNYSNFIEASQRRHLFTHCSGQVSQQYIDCCKTAGYKSDDFPPERGKTLKLGPTYFYSVCDVMFEVGVKLSHTLWRKQFPNELEEADKVLSDTIFELLKNERWNRAILIGEFAYSQKKHVDKERGKIVTANYCIALKFGGDEERSRTILESRDWSDSMPDFKIAKAVLLDDYEEAARLMEIIGKEGELITENSYLTWPLFRNFRSSDEFLKAYEKIYGYSFAVEAKKEVERSEEKAPQGTLEDEAEPGGAINDEAAASSR